LTSSTFGVELSLASTAVFTEVEVEDDASIFVEKPELGPLHPPVVSNVKVLFGDTNGEETGDPPEGILPPYFFSIFARSSTSRPLYFMRSLGTSLILDGLCV